MSAMRGTDDATHAGATPSVIHDYLRLYQGLGWQLVRIPPLSKAPLDVDWPTRHYDLAHFRAEDNVGVKLGDPSGGLIDVDLDCDEAVALAPYYLPATWTFGRDKRTTHYLYVTKGVKTHKPARAGIELRSTKLQTVVPGSVHESGHEILFHSMPGQSPLHIDPEVIVTAWAKLGFAVALSQAWSHSKGDHHSLVLSVAGGLWYRGWSVDDALATIVPAIGDRSDYERAIRDTWTGGAEKQRLGWPSAEAIVGPVAAGVMRRMVEYVPSVTRQEEAAIASDLHDVGNAERFAAMTADDVRWVPGLGWLCWDGTLWEPRDPTDMAIRVVRDMAEEAVKAEDIQRQKWAHQSLSAGRLGSMLTIASALDRRTQADDLDGDPWVLSTTNGVVDLRSGRLLSHSRERLVSKQCTVPYDPDATCPRFDRFLHEIMLGDLDLVNYLKRYLGYCLTGMVSEQMLGVWYGQGSNGKSTLIETLLQTLGTYAQKMSADLLTASKGRNSSAPTPEVARLKGARLVAGSETGEGSRWDEPLVKTLTGCDRVVARKLHQEPMEFDPTWKLMIAVNHKPIVRGTDHGIWRRIHLVPFDACFTEARMDKSLGQTLLQERSGILAMLVRGCLEWQRMGLAPPGRLLLETKQYRQEHDVVGAYLLECTRERRGTRLPKTQLYRSYRMWAGDNGEHCHGRSTFTRLMRERGQAESAFDWLDIELYG